MILTHDPNQKLWTVNVKSEVKMCVILVDHEELNSFLFGVGHFPERTPNQFELVADFVHSQRRDLYMATPSVHLGGSDRKDRKHLHLTDRTNCRRVFKVLKEKYPSLLQQDFNSSLFKQSGRSVFKLVILLPAKTYSCNKNIKIDNRPSFPLVYTMHCFMVSVRNAK